MRFQKILMLVSLVVAALTFVFAISFLTGSLGEITYYVTRTGGIVTDSANAQNFVDKSQAYVGTAVVLSIIFIVIAAFLFVTSSQSRRNYYITNYISVGLYVVFALVMAIFIIIMCSDCMNLFLNDVAWEAGTNGGKNIADQFLSTHPVTRQTGNFIVGYILAVIVLCDGVLMALSAVWKTLLMRGEKKLLAGSSNAEEVA